MPMLPSHHVASACHHSFSSFFWNRKLISMVHTRSKKMGRIKISLLTIVALTSTAIVSAWAASPHYKKGPTVVDNGLTATATGTLAGLGNGNVIVTLSFPNATGTTTCTNPGGNQAAGQNPATPAAVSGSQLITQVKNGTVSFVVTTDPPPNPTSAAAGCPNGNWTAAFDNITFGSGTITVQQETFQGSGVYVTVIVTNVSLS
jgi:hypothetical protein